MRNIRFLAPVAFFLMFFVDPVWAQTVPESDLQEILQFLVDLTTGTAGLIIVMIGFIVAAITAIASRSLIAFLFVVGLTLILKFMPQLLQALFTG